MSFWNGRDMAAVRPRSIGTRTTRKQKSINREGNVDKKGFVASHKPSHIVIIQIFIFVYFVLSAQLQVRHLRHYPTRPLYPPTLVAGNFVIHY